MEDNKIVLSEVIANDENRMIEWAEKVYAKVELSEEDKAISESVDTLIKRVDKLGSTVAAEEIAELVGLIVEPVVTQAPSEILQSIFREGNYDEFDKIKVMVSPKNTLVARESAARSGNVDKSYIDFTVGNVMERHLQIETEVKMSDLRRQGAFGIAQLAMFAIQEFNNKKFSLILAHLDSLIKAGGANYFPCATNLTKLAIDDFTGYLDDNVEEGNAEVVALSTLIRKIFIVAGIDLNGSDAMKDELNNLTRLKTYNGSYLVPVKAGKKLGNGETLLPKNKLFGFAGKCGEMYNKGVLRTLTTVDNKSEVIEIKFTGVEFGVCFTDLDKVAKIEITA